MRDVIKTERLVLRQLTLEDANAFSKLAGDIDISRMTGSIPNPFPLLSAEFKIMHLLSQKRRGLAYPYAVTQGGEDLIGVGDLFKRSSDDPLEIGYWIGKPFWNMGYITEVGRALIKEAQTTLGVTEFVAGVFFDNRASIRVLEKLGFEVTGESDPYFSIARLQKARSIDLRLTLKSAELRQAEDQLS